MFEIDPEGLREAMEAKGWQPSAFAKALGVSPQYVTDMRSGRRTLRNRADLRFKIAVVLDVPKRWIERRVEAA